MRSAFWTSLVWSINGAREIGGTEAGVKTFSQADAEAYSRVSRHERRTSYLRPAQTLSPSRRREHRIVMADSQTMDALLAQLLALLRGGQAHVTLSDAVKDFPAEDRGRIPDGLPYSAWQILEHVRITQRDILDFSAPPTGGYHGLQWPQDYWPKESAPPSPHDWDRTLAAIDADRVTFEALLLKPNADLYKPFLWGSGQNLLREALLVADHNAYHLGELVVVRRLLGNWKSA